MAQGSLQLTVTDVLNEAVAGTINVDLEPLKLSNNAGGQSMATSDFALPGDTEVTVKSIECLAGPGTLYRVAIHSSNYKTYAGAQRILEKRVNDFADNPIRLAVNPGRVKDIAAPDFGGLPHPLQQYLDQASPIADKPEDADIAELSGEALYDAMGPLRKASLLNLFTKANHTTTDGVFQFIAGQTLLVMRQDRLFTTIDPAVENFLIQSGRFRSELNTLHKPLAGYQLRQSFKSRDDHANIQVTLMRKPATGEMAADVDIDESSGLEHGIEVLSNVFRGRTNPYLVRDLMILSQGLSQDPGYSFIFR